MNNRSYHQKRTACRKISSLLSYFTQFSSASSASLRSEFSKSLYYRSVLFKRTNEFGYAFTNFLDRRIYEIKFPAHVSSIFLLIFYLYRRFNFSFYAQNLPFICDCSHVITLPGYC